MATSAIPKPARRSPAKPSEAWTVPLHVIMWTTLTVGFLMVVVVVMMR